MQENEPLLPFPHPPLLLHYTLIKFFHKQFLLKTDHRLRKIMTVTSSSSFLLYSSAEAASHPRLEEIVENNMDEAHLFFKANHETQHA